MNKYEQHRKMERIQANQKLINAAKTLAYANGLYDGGWLVECSGHVDGFNNDYCFVHSNPGNIACHRVFRVLVTKGDEAEYKEFLDEVLDACEKANSTRPEVFVITDELLTDCKNELKTAETDKTMEALLDELFEEQLDEGTVDAAQLAELI